MLGKIKEKLNGDNEGKYNGKTLICEGSKGNLQCRVDTKELPSLPADNIHFSLTTYNNLKSVNKNHQRMEVEADDNSDIFCREDRGQHGLVMKCRARGPNTPDFPDTWEPVMDLDSFHEIEDERVKSLFQDIIKESFPEREEELSFIKPMRMPHLRGISAKGVTTYWIDDYGRTYPVLVAFNPEVVDDMGDEDVRNSFKMTAIHELTHVSRWYGEKYTLERGKEEGETVTESLVRGDLKVRVKHPTPHGYVESIIYVPHCALPDQYCFNSLEEARDFEEYNYELVSGESQPRAINPENTPNWSEIERKIPAAPAVDMLKHMHGSYSPDSDVTEWWVNVNSQGGNNYLYSVYDLRVDGESLSLPAALRAVDEADAKISDEDIVSVNRSGG